MPRVASASRRSDESLLLSPSGRFPRAARLLTKAAYQAVFARARKLSDPYFLLLVVPGRHGGARLGMAISKRHARTAVERNRVKRLVRETFRAQRSSLPAVDVVVLLRDRTDDASNAVLRAGLGRLLGLLRERPRE